MSIFKSAIQIESSGISRYVQLANGISKMIETGAIPPGYKLPGSRSLANDLGLHRKTVLQAYTELERQGFINIVPAKGTFVSKKIPVLKPRRFEREKTNEPVRVDHYYHRSELRYPFLTSDQKLSIDEGLPDLRLSPVEEIRRLHNNLMSRKYHRKLLGYDSPAGDMELRHQMSNYLSGTRGLSISTENILITRGSQMGLFLTASILIKKNDIVIVGELNYLTASITLKYHGANLKSVPVDEDGIVVEAVEEICNKQSVRALYVTSHHHHPTTSTLSAQRRMELSRLADDHDFYILEDDYDYDFHYERSPIMPLASVDQCRRVIYMGSISKIVAPGLRIGFLVAEARFLEEAMYLRRIIDRQGSRVMERVMAQMVKDGSYQRHTKRALRCYHERRDVFVKGLASLHEYFDFKSPTGGLAVWAQLDPLIPLSELSKALATRGLSIPRWQNYDPEETGHNGIRLGFASLDLDEMKEVFEILQQTLDYLKLQTS